MSDDIKDNIISIIVISSIFASILSLIYYDVFGRFNEITLDYNSKISIIEREDIYYLGKRLGRVYYTKLLEKIGYVNNRVQVVCLFKSNIEFSTLRTYHLSRDKKNKLVLVVNENTKN